MIDSIIPVEYFWFTEKEVKNLCCQYKRDFREIEHWYGGYYRSKETQLYRTDSVIKALFRGECSDYQNNTVFKEHIPEYYKELGDIFGQMLSEKRYKVNECSCGNNITDIRSIDDALTLWIYLGYLTYDSEAKEVYIPNEELRHFFKKSYNG